MKIDLYKIDFSQKDAKGNVPVTQVWTKTLGEQGSQTEALSNPRMFMFNDATKELLLPIAIATIQKTQQCNVIYGSNGAEIRKECYPQEMPVTQFAGIKGWKLSTDGISETVSMDYKNILINPYGYPTASSGSIDPWVFTSLIPRVGYVGNTYYFINSQFAHLFSLSNSIGKKIDFTQAPQVIYPPVVTPLKAE